MQGHWDGVFPFAPYKPSSSSLAWSRIKSALHSFTSSMNRAQDALSGNPKMRCFFPDICLVATGVNQNRLFRRHPHFHWIIYAYPIIFPAASPETASVSNRTAARTPSSVFSMVHSAPCRAKIIFTRYSPRPLPPVARFREVSSR